jgi:hypothetical protein
MNDFIPPLLKEHFANEIREYRLRLAKKEYRQAFQHLERAHILGQPYPIEHTLAHWHMLRFGFVIKSAKEIHGQLLRLLAGGVKSFIGTIPEGNTGGANVPPLKKMAIPADIQYIIRTTTQKRYYGPRS